jgi:hypothetical protein
MAQASKDTESAAVDQPAPADGKPLFPTSAPLPVLRTYAHGGTAKLLVLASAKAAGPL